MNEYAFILGIAGVLLAGAMSPGPSFFVVAQNSLSKSRGHGVATALGTGLGVAMFTVLASLGVTTLIETVPSVYLVFKIAGGIYLLYLAWRIWQGAPTPLQTQTIKKGEVDSYYKSFLTGLITQISNPKTALVIAGIFAAFVPQNPPEFTALIVSLIAFIIDFSWYAIVAITLSLHHSKDVYGRVKVWFDRIAAGFLGIVGIKLMVS